VSGGRPRHGLRPAKPVGDPDRDWLAVRKELEDSACPRLKEIAAELRNVRLLVRGTHSAKLWPPTGETMALTLAITRQAFVHEHSASVAGTERGVIVMNMHKAKASSSTR